MQAVLANSTVVSQDFQQAMAMRTARVLRRQGTPAQLGEQPLPANLDPTQVTAAYYAVMLEDTERREKRALEDLTRLPAPRPPNPTEGTFEVKKARLDCMVDSLWKRKLAKEAAQEAARKAAAAAAAARAEAAAARAEATAAAAACAEAAAAAATARAEA